MSDTNAASAPGKEVGVVLRRIHPTEVCGLVVATCRLTRVMRRQAHLHIRELLGERDSAGSTIAAVGDHDEVEALPSEG